MPVLPPTLQRRLCQASWSLVEEFNQQYEELLAQTWLELRPRLFVVQDLAHNWMAKLREVPRDQVTHMLSQEVQRLEAAHPALKAMTGEPFERDHWKILFGLIKLPPDLRLEELRFKDLAQRLNVIVDKVDELKELTARAIGEVTIRDAVMEVSAWFEQAEFNLMDHQAGLEMCSVLQPVNYSPCFAWGGRPHRRFISVRERG